MKSNLRIPVKPSSSSSASPPQAARSLKTKASGFVKVPDPAAGTGKLPFTILRAEAFLSR
jgi:hypothetical protein